MQEKPLSPETLAPIARFNLPGRQRRISLGAWLVGVNGIIVLILISVGVWLSFQTGSRALEDMIQQSLRRAANEVATHLVDYLRGPENVTRLLSDAILDRRADADDPDSVFRDMSRLLRVFPDVNYLNVATADGHFFGLGHADNSKAGLVAEQSTPSEPAVLRQFSLEADGSKGKLLKELPFSDPRQQPWYRAAIERREGAWSRIYSWVDNPQVIVASFGMPVGKDPFDVVAADMFLPSISDFLAGLQLSPLARVFIVERNGLLVASSLTRMPFGIGPDGATRLHAAATKDPAVAGSIARLQQLPHGMAGVRELQVLQFDAPERWFVAVKPWSNDSGLDWLIVFAVPESDFSGTVVDSSNRTVALAIVLLLVGLLALLCAAEWLLRPVRRIEWAARAIAEGDLGTRVPEGGFGEFDRLARSFNSMTVSLANARANLENEVHRRTEELRTANGELERLSREDSLTGLANRRCLDPRLQEEWLRARRSGETLGLIVCDVDNFKAYNDHYGHTAGDEALRRIATVLSSCLRRPADLAARYGGEEFVLLLPGMGLNEAARFAGEIRQCVLELAIPHSTCDRGVITLSFGVAVHSPDNPASSTERLFEAADDALYKAKELGRDRIELAPARPA